MAGTCRRPSLSDLKTEDVGMPEGGGFPPSTAVSGFTSSILTRR